MDLCCSPVVFLSFRSSFHASYVNKVLQSFPTHPDRSGVSSRLFWQVSADLIGSRVRSELARTIKTRSCFFDKLELTNRETDRPRERRKLRSAVYPIENFLGNNQTTKRRVAKRGQNKLSSRHHQANLKSSQTIPLLPLRPVHGHFYKIYSFFRTFLGQVSNQPGWPVW